MRKNRKSILFITPQLPYPPSSGGTIISFKMIDFLSKKYDLNLVCLLKTEEDVLNESIFKKEFVESFSSYKSFILDKNIFSRKIINLLKSYILRVPFSVYRNSNNEMKEYIEWFIKNNKVDVIILDHFLTFQFIEKIINLIKTKEIKILLHEHNAEFLIFERYAKSENNIIKKIISYIESQRVKKYEKKICLLSDLVLCVSSNDIENLIKIGVDKNKLKLVMSLGDEELLLRKNLVFEDTEECILFIGTLSWEANVDGLIWFITNAWNKIKKEVPNLKFYIIGKNPPQKLITIINNYRDIILTGYVENLEEYYKKCRVFISPLRFGSGIKIKNINAMYRGIPIVTTSIGAEGINGKDGEHFFIADDIENFTHKILTLIKDKEIWQKLSYNSRDLMRREYTWEKAMNVLEQIIENI